MLLNKIKAAEFYKQMKINKFSDSYLEIEINYFMLIKQPKIKCTKIYILNDLHVYIKQKLYVLVSFHIEVSSIFF